MNIIETYLKDPYSLKSLHEKLLAFSLTVEMIKECGAFDDHPDPIRMAYIGTYRAAIKDQLDMAYYDTEEEPYDHTTSFIFFGLELTRSGRLKVKNQRTIIENENDLHQFLLGQGLHKLKQQ